MGLFSAMKSGFKKARAKQQARKKQILRFFRAIDRDGNGYLSPEEFSVAIRKISDKMSELDLAALFALADKNVDDKINHAEFLEWILSAGKEPSMMLKKAEEADLEELLTAIKDGGGFDTINEQRAAILETMVEKGVIGSSQAAATKDPVHMLILLLSFPDFLASRLNGVPCELVLSAVGQLNVLVDAGWAELEDLDLTAQMDIVGAIEEQFFEAVQAKYLKSDENAILLVKHLVENFVSGMSVDGAHLALYYEGVEVNQAPLNALSALENMPKVVAQHASLIVGLLESSAFLQAYLKSVADSEPPEAVAADCTYCCLSLVAIVAQERPEAVVSKVDVVAKFLVQALKPMTEDDEKDYDCEADPNLEAAVCMGLDFDTAALQAAVCMRRLGEASAPWQEQIETNLTMAIAFCDEGLKSKDAEIQLIAAFWLSDIMDLDIAKPYEERMKAVIAKVVAKRPTY